MTSPASSASATARSASACAGSAGRSSPSIRIPTAGSRSSTPPSFTGASPRTSSAAFAPPATRDGRSSPSSRGPMPQYELATRMINDERLSLAHVHTFNMDEYANEDGVTAPPSSPGSFQRAMLERFFGLVDAELRPPEAQIHFPTTEAIRDYSARIEDLRRRRLLLRRHRLVRPHRLLGVTPGRGVRRRSRGVQAGRCAPRRAAPVDDHAKRTPLLRRGLVVGAAEGEHSRAP